MATYVIGDVQGCDDELGELLALIQFEPQKDRVLFVGDLVNRGPKSAAVLRRIRALNLVGAADSVLGNHDFFLIMAFEGLSKVHPGDTLDDVLDAPDASELVAWLRQRPLVLPVKDRLIVHAGFLPAWSRTDALAFAREIETALRSPTYRAFLETLFGNEPNAWHPALTGVARARVIVNALARLRFCSAFSEIEFKEKRDITHAKEGRKAWFCWPNRRSADCAVIAGHWSSEGLRLMPNVSLLDSGCLWGGALTAQRIDDGAIFQVPSRQPHAVIGD
ncbi:MAG: symmetrical bis(5'-nucleosyl)-tetraphosphatase [Betaproteobacteria bacterium]|nr:MAG: symmetrical bis(5'-nucleosyl)-tetraphosphatase [Betaproteobacteria bacterium]